MTPAEIKKTRLYRTLAPCVRKEDREELARMLAMVKSEIHMAGFSCDRLMWAFDWEHSPQGWEYWAKLSNSLYDAGHACW